MVTRSLVSVVDDDESVRESLPDLLRQFGFSAQVFPSAEAFLASGVVARDQLPHPRRRDARDVRTGASTRTGKRQHKLPIVFITASGDRSVRAELLAAGAVECLFKPFSETALLDALNAAVRTVSDSDMIRSRP